MNYANVFKDEDKKRKKENIERMKKYKLDRLTLLGINKICGSDQLDIFKKYGLKASMTDFACILGGYSSTSKKEYTSDGKRSGEWWTATQHDYESACLICPRGKVEFEFISRWWNIGVRPALIYPSNISSYYNIIKDSSGLDAILYGEYPQYLADIDISKELETEYKYKKLKITGKYYTAPDFSEKYIEYEYKGNRYIRVWCDANPERGYIFSNGKPINSFYKEIYWIKVEPIIWLVESNIAISKYLLFSGISYIKEKYSVYRKDEFYKTDIAKFLDNVFKYEIETDIEYDYESVKPSNQINDMKKEKTLESVIEEAKMEMREILGEEYSYILNETQEESFQKVKKMVL